MRRIDKNSSIFETDEYKKDKNKFYIIEMNLSSLGLMLYSDEASYVICRGEEGRPTWVWTADDITDEKMSEALSVITDKYLSLTESTKYTAKKEFYSYLKRVGYPYLGDEYFEMGALECKNAKRPVKCRGYSEKAKSLDIDLLAEYWRADNLEMNISEPITPERAKKDVEEMLDSGNLWVLRDENEKIVSMVWYKITGDQVKLSHVYTPPEKRGLGYASTLIYEVTEMLLGMGLTPLLYTDYNYPPSNKAYKNAGYDDMGILINFNCKKRKY